MPLGPLPDSTTNRLEVFYTAGGRAHTFKLRASNAATAAGAVTFARGLITQLLPTLGTNVTFTRANWGAAGVPLTFPVSWGAPLVGANASQDVTQTDEPRFVSFSGRDTEGRRARLFIFGYRSRTEGDWRLEPGDDPDVDNAIRTLTGNTTYGVSISANPVTWYQTANIAFSAYWTRAARRS